MQAASGFGSVVTSSATTTTPRSDRFSSFSHSGPVPAPPALQMRGLCGLPHVAEHFGGQAGSGNLYER